MAAPKQGGFKMSLGGLKAKPGLKAVTAQKDVKRRRLALDDDEPEETNKQQEIVGWDAAEGGALDIGGKKEKEGPRIIPVQPNVDWRIEARRKQLAKAPHTQEQKQKEKGNTEMEIEEPKAQFGLTFVEKKDEQINGAEQTAPEPMEVENDNLTEEQRLEKKALDALISGKSTDEDLVIPVVTEDEALHNDLDNAPEAPTLEAYEAQPIEGFGAALLRGMGWKDGDALGKNGKVVSQKVKRRPALLGIGAKEEAAVGIELGEWGPKGKGKKAAQAYNPVVLKNKKTGEMITEDELKAKLENQDMVKEEKPPKDRSRYDDEDEDHDRRREKRRDRRDDKDRDRRRDDDYESERRRDRDSKDDRRRDKRRERDDDYDSERRREKRRDRTRSPDDRKDRKRDRYRSRSRDDGDRRHRRRERSRSRDSEDRRKRRRDKDYDDDRDERRKRH